MQYELSNLRKNNISLSRNQIFPIIGLYFFVLGTSLLGFSVYLFLESAGIVEQTLINWNGQGLFWSFITFFASLFILFIPVEFFDKYFIENRSFRNLLTNVVSVIFISLFFLQNQRTQEINILKSQARMYLIQKNKDLRLEKFDFC